LAFRVRTALVDDPTLKLTNRVNDLAQAAEVRAQLAVQQEAEERQQRNNQKILQKCPLRVGGLGAL
jgi:hypothetical protein